MWNKEIKIISKNENDSLHGNSYPYYIKIQATLKHNRGP